MSMQFGAFAPQGWKMDLASIDGAANKWARCREVALLAEELGYDSIWVYDHFHNVPTPAHEAVFECWTTMAALAEATSRIRLGQMVSCTSYRAPTLTAKITSSIDVISGGRLEWGVGAGWYDHEYKAYGYEFPAPKVRIGMLAEAVEIVKAMWTEPDTTYEGTYYKVRGAQCDPKPIQEPHPPVWIGGGGEQLTLRVVARHADRSNFGGKPDEFAHKLDVLKGHCGAVGRDYDEIAKTWSPELIVRGTEREARTFHEARRKAQPWLEEWDGYRLGNLAGSAEQVAERIGTYEEMGCAAVVPWIVDYPSDETLRRFATDVIPELR
ncbi:MAG TPA: LLM class F420-dependent oxidoreductase [Acidimicrobiia bacterium]|jgi:F420-dependent oxidoreductase-like protein